jgi:hypothetical protein
MTHFKESGCLQEQSIVIENLAHIYKYYDVNIEKKKFKNILPIILLRL